MTEKPILFSTPMVQAILAGKKTQTRRVIKMDTLEVIPRFNVHGDFMAATTEVLARKPILATMNRYGAVSGLATDGTILGLKPNEFDFKCYYCEGSTSLRDQKWIIKPIQRSMLWVRETWKASGLFAGCSICDTRACDRFVYKADEDQLSRDQVVKWKPSIFMPRWASRITLEIKSVRVEPLQDINDDDAENEGYPFELQMPDDPRPVKWFKGLWDSINGKTYPWESNPWVWVIEFERIS